MEFIIPVESTSNLPLLLVNVAEPALLLTVPEIVIPVPVVFCIVNDVPLEVIVPPLVTFNNPALFVNVAEPVLFVTLPPTNKPLVPVSLVTSKSPSFLTVPFKANLVPDPLFVNVIVPLFLTNPVVFTSKSPAEFVTVKLPLAFETSPAILTPDAPVFVIVVLPVP